MSDMDRKDNVTAFRDLFFIVARGRSGTDLLRAMLNRHQAITVAPEGLFVMNLYRKYGRGTWNESRILAFYRDLWKERRLQNWWRIDKSRLKGELLAVGQNATFAGLCRIVYANHAATEMEEDGTVAIQPEHLLGDKNPTYALFVPELLELFPQARFIHVVRDYRDTVLSFQNVRFDLSGTASLAERWREYNARILEACRRHPERFHTLRYEDLVAAPESTLRGVCCFLGVGFERKMLSFHENQRHIREWQTNIAVPVDSSRASSWRERMNPKHLRIVDAICGTLGTEFGYKTADNGTPGGLLLSAVPGVIVGRAATFLERNIFRLPFWLRTVILTAYRRLTGSLVD